MNEMVKIIKMIKKWRIEIVFHEKRSEQGSFASTRDMVSLVKFVCNKVVHESQGRVTYNFEIKDAWFQKEEKEK